MLGYNTSQSAALTITDDLKLPDSIWSNFSDIDEPPIATDRYVVWMRKSLKRKHSRLKHL